VRSTAIITGVTGQDGAFLAKLLLDEGIHVIGGVRRTGGGGLWRLAELGIDSQVEIRDFELLEYNSIATLLRETRPDYFFNLAAQSFVGNSFGQPLLTLDTNAGGVIRILEALRLESPETRFYQASTSEMFGKVQDVPQSESTPFYPRSPYGIAKLAAHWAVVNYREAWGLHASSGILFNHESPLRGLVFVTRKITAHLAEVVAGHRDRVMLGNLDALRDWGYAGDYVRGMYNMVSNDKPDDYVLATGSMYSVRDFCTTAANALDLDIDWEGEHIGEVGRNARTGKIMFAVDRDFYRPAEVDQLRGDAGKARTSLAWAPTTSFEQLVTGMAKRDVGRAQMGPIIF
jgi:GDPmannose 4,6-dehydratase